MTEHRPYYPTVFFPGSFRPWHLGHSACLEQLNQWAREHHKLQVLLLPDHNPRKTEQGHFSTEVTWEELARPIEEEIERLKPKLDHLELKLSAMLFTKPKPNPSHRWLSELRQQNPDLGPFQWLLGLDSFLEMPSWIEAPKVFSLIGRLWVVPRHIPEVNQQLIEQFEGQKHRLLHTYPHLEIHWLGRHQQEHLSSTKLRQRT